MSDGFWSGLNQKLIFWSGWVFTVGGAIAALIVGKEYWWIAGLVIVAGLLALMAFAYQKHREKVDAEYDHQAEVQQLMTERDQAKQASEEAARKLNELPSEILLRLQATIQANSFVDLASILADYASYLERISTLMQTATKPISVRTFFKRAGILYGDARMNAEAMKYLRQSDPFVLEFKDPNSLLITRSARLQVHQLDPTKEVVWFRVDQIIGDEMAHLDALAGKQEVPAKGYLVRPMCDPERYSRVNLVGAADLIRLMVEEIARERN